MSASTPAVSPWNLPNALTLLRIAMVPVYGVLLLTATRDVEHSGAIVLEQVLTGMPGTR